MEMKSVSLDQYLESILTMYNDMDGAHGVQHIREVIDNITELGIYFGLSLDICKTIAVYHDLGLKIDRDKHHMFSGLFVRADTGLRQYFNKREIEIIAKACEEHRASYKGEYFSMYSYVISDADRVNTLERMIERCYDYTIAHYQNLSEDDIYNRVYAHLVDKYGRENGYGAYNLKESYDIFNMEDIWNTLDDEESFKIAYSEMLSEKIKA